MEIGGLSLIGLLFATATSVTNVFADVARKKALDKHDLIAASLSIKFFAALTYTGALSLRLLAGHEVRLRDDGPVFGFEALAFSPPVTFLIYLAMDVSLVACATLLYYRAVQVSPLSLCIPFIAFTPVFLIPTGYVLLRELPSTVKLIGVVLVVAGSLVMHRQLFAVSWAEPFKAILRERGSRYMLMVAFIFSLTNPLDAWLVRMSDAFTQAFAYGLSICLLFGAVALVRRADWRMVMRAVPLWVVMAGALEAAVNILQFSSHNYIAVVITISLKRAGIVLVVLMGWLIFKERGITDKLIAATVMVAGALMFYLPMSLGQSLAIAAVVMVGMSLALYLTRRRGAAAAQSIAVSPVSTRQ
jgi:drug/metabolite transporter (DMT)-like permease